MRRIHVSPSRAPIGVSLVVLALAGCGGKAPPAPAVPAGPPPTPTIEQVRSATVSGVFDQAVTLVDGRYEGEPFEPGAASGPVLTLWEPTFHTGDLDDTEGSEAVAVLSSNSRGTGAEQGHGRARSPNAPKEQGAPLEHALLQLVYSSRRPP